MEGCFKILIEMSDNTFKKFGTTLELFSYGLTPQEVSSDVIDNYNSADANRESELIEHVYTKLASSFANLLRVTNKREYAPEILVLTKVASANKDQWNPYYQNVVDACIGSSTASVDGMLKYANPATAGFFKALPGVLGSLPGLAIASIPVLGALLAGSAYFTEKELNEDNATVELQKAKNIAYRTLAADVARRLRDEGLSLGPEDTYTA